MNILVIGGTRFTGVHLIKNLLAGGHSVTAANRGLIPDGFGNSINRIIIERTDPNSLKNMLGNKRFDIIYDNIAFCSNDVKYLLDIAGCGRYIQMSTVSVYTDYKENIPENAFNPKEYELKWCSRNDFDYGEIKRQAECAIFQTYENIKSTSVRFPYITGTDDYTKRLYFYAEHVVKFIPMSVDNLNERMAFVSSNEAGIFLAWLAEKDFNGCINAGSYGNISIAEIIKYVENKTSKKAVYSEDGDKAPYNGVPSFSLNLSKAATLGYKFSDLNTWIYNLLDKLLT